MRHIALIIGMSLSASAFAAQVTYEFTSVHGDWGSFSHDDALPTPQQSFSLNGVSLPNSVLQLSNNSFWGLADFVGTRLDTGATSGSLATLQQVASIPEPGFSALMALGLIALVAARQTKPSLRHRA